LKGFSKKKKTLTLVRTYNHVENDPVKITSFRPFCLNCVSIKKLSFVFMGANPRALRYEHDKCLSIRFRLGRCGFQGTRYVYLTVFPSFYLDFELFLPDDWLRVETLLLLL